MTQSQNRVRVARELERLAEAVLSEDELAILRGTSDRWRRFHGYSIDSWLRDASAADIAIELIAVNQNKSLEVAGFIHKQLRRPDPSS